MFNSSPSTKPRRGVSAAQHACAAAAAFFTAGASARRVHAPCAVALTSAPPRRRRGTAPFVCLFRRSSSPARRMAKSLNDYRAHMRAMAARAGAWHMGTMMGLSYIRAWPAVVVVFMNHHNKWHPSRTVVALFMRGRDHQAISRQVRNSASLVWLVRSGSPPAASVPRWSSQSSCAPPGTSPGAD